MRHIAYLALGGNLGDTLVTFRDAMTSMLRDDVVVQAVSRAYRTRAMLPPGDLGPAPDYWNAVCQVDTVLSPEQLLRYTQVLEHAAGRVRTTRWGSRTLDIDILLYDDQVVDTPHLQLPHPGLTSRVFVLQPLSELAPDLIVPTTQTRVADHLAQQHDRHDAVLSVLDQWSTLADLAPSAYI